QLSISSLFLNNLETADRQVLREEDKESLLTESNTQFNLDCPLNELEDRISKCCSELEKMPMPNITVLEEFRACKTRFEEKQQLLAHHLEVSSVQKKLRDSLKDLRLLVFNKSLVLLNRHLKLLYNAITMGGTAELEVVDVISPFAQGLQLTVMPPNKAWKVIGNLSGGEKTLSSLALLFSLHALRPAPFYILDEIDAALDFRNVAIIASYLKWQAERNTQFLVISLREHMYSNAERFVAVYKYADKSKTLVVRNIDLEDDNSSKKLVM
ncbi:MAG: Structural maintenance of chromosomes protein 4, partial [Marteilia pararefringens]